MAKIPSTLCALSVLSASALFAQEPAVLPPPVGTPGAPAANPATPAPIPGLSVPAPLTPAPIDPPIAVPVPGGAQVAVPPAIPDGTVPAQSAPAPSASRTHEFQGDEIGLVLRTLARQAGVTLIVSDKVAAPGSTVTARIENKTPIEALGIIVDSKGLIMDDKNGVLYVKTQEEKAKEPTESASYTLSYGAAKDIIPLLQSQLQSGVAPQFDQRTNTVFFREAKSNVSKVMEFLASIDRPTQQVMIEARLVEVTANPKQSYGINWAGVVGGATTPQTFRYGGTTIATSKYENGILVPDTPPTVVTNQTNGTFRPQELLREGDKLKNLLNAVSGQFAILSIPQMSATLRLLNEDSDAEFLANQRVVTANNTKAEIKVIRSEPVPQLNFNEQTAQAVFGGFQDKDYGNTLDVTPIINKDGFVSLTVKPEISNKVRDATFIFGGAAVNSPVIDKRSLTSNVVIHSGDTLAIGGLVQDEGIKGRTKVPILGDIPIIGYAFQERLNSRSKRNLLIFVTPTVIQQGYGTGLEDQVSGLHHSGEEFADPNGWRNNAKGAYRLTPTSNRQFAADIPKPGLPPAPRKPVYKVSAGSRP